MDELLRVEGLCKRYPGFSLEDVTFSLAPGRVMGLIGRNGAGKSTLLKSLLNMVRPQSGSVTMFGMDFYRNEAACKQQLGVVFGGVDFYPLKKLSAITATTAGFYRDFDPARYRRCMQRFGLAEDKPFRTLSSGMKVKYLLALALSHHARLLILDEPTSGLDPVSREELLHIFRRVVATGDCSILFSTHITGDLDRCADDITYLRDGRVLQSAQRDAFLRAFAHLKTPQDTGKLTLEQIMLRTQRSDWDEETVL